MVNYLCRYGLLRRYPGTW